MKVYKGVQTIMDMDMKFFRKLPVPKDLKEQFPADERIVKIKQERDPEIRRIFEGKSDKLLLIIGPCSADREDAVLDYVTRLSKVQEKVKDKIMIIPRIYTNKPRTTGGGYKGLVHQPDPEKKPDMLQGIIAVRELHQKAILESGLTCADEMLYPENHRYVSDLLSYVAIGARSVEDQQHRLTASGVGIPVGMKNPTGGDLSVMMNSITAAQGQHVFLYRGWEVQSLGNPYAHALLRGYVDKHGKTYSNYHYEDLNELFELYQEHELKNPGVIIDTNHANSGKHYLEQIRIAKEVLHSCRLSKDIKGLVKGLMIESYIEPGNQKIGEHIYGKSITDEVNVKGISSAYAVANLVDIETGEYIKNNENALRDFLLVSNKYYEVKMQMLSDSGMTSIVDVEVNNMRPFVEYRNQFEAYVRDKKWLFQTSYFSVDRAITHLREEYDRLVTKVDTKAM